MNITLPAYCFSDTDETLFAAQLCFNPDGVRTLQARVELLVANVPDFRELTVRFNGRADFITSVPDPDVEALFLNEAGTDVVLRSHAEPISDEFLDTERVQNVNLHMTKEGFYVKGFAKHWGGMMETELVKFSQLDSLVG